MDRILFDYVYKAKNRMQILMTLEKHFKNPAQISEDTGIFLSVISKRLVELVEKKLVFIENEDLPRKKLYTVTEEGKKMCRTIRKFEKNKPIRFN
ncbi:MAG: hypothetical protein PF569_08060 [Candidatus Woesearchaeota archaeon]|jgi:predicted transcriptional regulator|nr:hypothetical protein [Candidatus Woesearchaeota archaeon]